MSNDLSKEQKKKIRHVNKKKFMNKELIVADTIQKDQSKIGQDRDNESNNGQLHNGQQVKNNQ